MPALMQYTPLIHIQDDIANTKANLRAILPVIGNLWQTKAYFNNNFLVEWIRHSYYFISMGKNMFIFG